MLDEGAGAGARFGPKPALVTSDVVVKRACGPSPNSCGVQRIQRSEGTQWGRRSQSDYGMAWRAALATAERRQHGGAEGWGWGSWQLQTSE